MVPHFTEGKKKKPSVHWSYMIPPPLTSLPSSPTHPPHSLLTGFLAVLGTGQVYSCLRALAQAVPLLGMLLLHGLNLLKHSPLSESILTIPFKIVTSATHHFPCPFPSYLLPQQLSSDTLYNYLLVAVPPCLS